MAEERSWMRHAEDDLLHHAARVLRLRYERGHSFSELSPEEALGLEQLLTSTATAEGDLEGVDREEAVKLAHRLVDDDEPESSPLWPARRR